MSAEATVVLRFFENVYPIPDGVSCNSYVLLDEKTVCHLPALWLPVRPGRK